MGGAGFDFLSFHARLPVTFSSPLKLCRTGVWQLSTRGGEKKKQREKINKEREEKREDEGACAADQSHLGRRDRI